MSVDTTIKGYLVAGATAEKILVGIALYGHTWYVPGSTGSAWQNFGVKATVQGACCGPFGSTYGAKYGKGCQLCGSMMASEIVAAGPTAYWDNTTQTSIEYFPTDSADGWTKAGTWVSYIAEDGITAVAKYVVDNGLGGAFVYDASMDTVDFSSGQPTFKMMNLIAQTLAAGSDEGDQ